MPAYEVYATAFEYKFVDGAPEGVISGYAAVFGNVDSHGDMIVPGAFKESLAERKAANRPIPMHVMHRVFGGDGMPAGVWSKIEEDDTGLRVEGKISGMNTDRGRMMFELVKDGALAGVSIGYKVRGNGATYGKKAGEPKRTLKSLSLHEISLVDDPSNALSRVQEIKAAAAAAAVVNEPGDTDPESAATDLAAAIIMFDKMMQSYGSYGSAKDMALIMDRLREAYEALTGTRVPDGLDGWMKSAFPTIRDVEGILRAGGLSHSNARSIVERGYKASPPPRDEAGNTTDTAARKEALTEMASALVGFSLTS